MIAVSGSTVLHVGGWRGDRLFVGRGGGAFERVTDLGWDAALQLTPQRRILVAGETCLVLEPVEGAVLRDEVRVRRLDLGGNELDRDEGADPVEDPYAIDWLHYHAWDTEAGQLTVNHYAVDPDRGRALNWRTRFRSPEFRWGFQDAGLPGRRERTWYYPMRGRGLVEAGPDGARILPGRAGTPVRIGDRVCVPGDADGESGVWIDGQWRALPGPAPLVGGKIPLGPIVAPHGDGGLALLRRFGGALGVLDGPPASLPPGVYEGLLALPEGLFGLAVGDSPALVRAVL